LAFAFSGKKYKVVTLIEESQFVETPLNDVREFIEKAFGSIRSKAPFFFPFEENWSRKRSSGSFGTLYEIG